MLSRLQRLKSSRAVNPSMKFQYQVIVVGVVLVIKFFIKKLWHTQSPYTMHIRCTWPLRRGQAFTWHHSSFVDPEISQALTASDVTQTSVSLSWSILDTRHFDRIRVNQKRTDSSAEAWMNASSTSSHTVTSLTAGTTYEFYVQIYSYGNSAKTSTITVTTGAISLSLLL